MKVFSGIQYDVADCQSHKAVHDKYVKIGWKTRQAAFAEKHKNELTAYNKAYYALKKHGVDLTVDLDALKRKEARTEALHFGEIEVRAGTEETGAESSAAQKPEYRTLRHLPFSVFEGRRGFFHFCGK